MPASSIVAGARPATSSATKMPCWKPAVGELEAGDDVADGVDAVDVGVATVVGQHEAALHRDTLLVVAEPVGRRSAADGHEQQLGLDDVATLDGHRDAVVGDLHGLERRARADHHAALAERPLERLRRGLVLGSDESRQRLDDRDVSAERPPDTGELAADHAAAQHDHGRRHLVETQRVLAGDHAAAVDLEAGERLGIGAGREDDVLADVGLAVDGDLARTCEPALSLDDGDAAALDQAGEPLEETGDDAVLVAVDAGHVDAVEGGSHAELLGVARRVGDLGGVEQRLGRDAADVEAGPAEVPLLDQADAQSELGRSQRTGVAARSRPENEYVELGRHAGPSALTCLFWFPVHPCTSP